MKINKAPEKIYLSTNENGTHYYTEGIPFEREYIEYARTDVFIEKACELLAKMIWEVSYEDLEGNSVQHHDKMEFIEDFKNYMKGE